MKLATSPTRTGHTASPRRGDYPGADFSGVLSSCGGDYWDKSFNSTTDGEAGKRAIEAMLEVAGYAADRGSISAGEHDTARVIAAEEPPDIFVYDPGNPVPSRGGASCCCADVAPVGAFDQQSIEIRNDVLVYTSAPLASACDVVGPVELVLHAATDGPDTDWTAKLVDVHPDGRAINVCDGIIRARYRNSLSEPALLEPGIAYEYRIHLGATATRFSRGHCIRLRDLQLEFPNL